MRALHIDIYTTVHRAGAKARRYDTRGHKATRPRTNPRVIRIPSTPRLKRGRVTWRTGAKRKRLSGTLRR